MRDDRHIRASGPALRRCACAVFVLAALAACDRTPEGAADAEPASAAPAPAPIDPTKTMHPADLKDVTASYRCEGGHRIDIVRDQVARLALADGRVLKIEAIGGSVPRTFVDVGLTISLVSDDEAKLDDEKGNTVSCTKIETLRPAST